MINTGAVIVEAGMKDAALLPAGNISVAQRMVSAFRKAGTGLIVVVTDPEDKALEKQLSQSGVMFLRSNKGLGRESAARMGLEYLCNKCERIFLMDADRPLVFPGVLSQMLRKEGELVVPTYAGVSGRPLLFSAEGAKKALNSAKPMLDTVYLPVEDEGVLLTSAETQTMVERFKIHDSAITNITLDLSINCGKQIVDKKLISLLYLIDETQSVREACGRMHLSYSGAWNILNQAEAELDFALVHRNKGGASGSGTVLTEKGSRLLRAYLDFDAMVSSNAEKLYEQFFKGII